MKTTRCYLCGSADIPTREYSLYGIRDGKAVQSNVCICIACKEPAVDQYLKLKYRLDSHPTIIPKAG